MVATIMISAISLRLVALGALFLSVAALASALTAEHVFGLRPCELCLLQRKPFMVAAIVAAIALLPALAGFRRALIAGLALMFLTNSGFAIYHVGVERKWWASTCAPTESGPLDVTNLAAAMNNPVEVRCDQPAWEWNGITMAGLNVVFSGGLGLIALGFAARRRNAG